jgi:saccharopine dehydrogenase-like NADP-dependent oxidoreductase
VGGTGRVGASTASALAAMDGGLAVDLFLAGRSRESADRAKSQWAGLEQAVFLECDITSPASLANALDGADLVIHCAGPFQKRATCEVLEAAILAKVPYIDVCDDMAFAKKAKKLHERAKAAGVPAITTTGIYPGMLPSHLSQVYKNNNNQHAYAGQLNSVTRLRCLLVLHDLDR